MINNDIIILPLSLPILVMLPISYGRSLYPTGFPQILRAFPISYERTITLGDVTDKDKYEHVIAFLIVHFGTTY